MGTSVTKVKPIPNGFWYTTKWDMIRAMRSGADYIAVVNNEIKTRAELLGSDIDINGELFRVESTGSVNKIKAELNVTA